MQVIAHRGASGSYPENTIAAIEAALRVGVDAIELDVYSCLNGFVIIHDSYLERTTNGAGKVEQFAEDFFATLDAGNGQAVPTLSQALTAIGKTTCIQLELKTIQSVEILVHELQKHIKQDIIELDQLLISSFNHHLVLQIKQALPQVRVAALTSSIPLQYAQFAETLNAYSIHIDANFINQAFVDDAKSRGLKVFVYTVDKLSEIDRMVELGVDGIFTNYPCQSKMYLQQITSNLK